MRRRRFFKVLLFFYAGLLAILGVSGCALPWKKTDESKTPQDSRVSSGPKMKVRAYYNGSYPVTEIFASPGGQETMELKVFITNDVIEHVDFSGKWSDPVAQSINEAFGPTLVQNVLNQGAEVEVDAITGATLSVKSFQEGLRSAFKQAKIQ